jgi:hypothetical protein
MSEITIKSTIKEITGWNKEITFEREGETYVATLYWDFYKGYDITFHNPSLFKPTWTITGYNWDMTLEELLDELTDGEQKGECDKCDASYDVGSQDNRCGNCGNCGNCCTHNGEGESNE